MQDSLLYLAFFRNRQGRAGGQLERTRSSRGTESGTEKQTGPTGRISHLSQNRSQMRCIQKSTAVSSSVSDSSAILALSMSGKEAKALRNDPSLRAQKCWHM